MKFFLTIISVIVGFVSWSQLFERYADCVSQAEEAYEAHAYREAANLYNEAFAALNGLATNYDVWRAACCWAMANEPDSAFKYLFRIAEPGPEALKNSDELNNEPAFKALHAKAEWTDLVAQVNQNYESSFANRNENLIQALAKIYDHDQIDRQTKFELTTSGMLDSAQLATLNDRIEKNDSVNRLKVGQILDEHGWLGTDVVGYEGNKTLFLVLQHANLEMQLKYFPLMEEAVKKGAARASHLAMLEDKIAIKQGEKQIYGSQIKYDPDQQKYFVRPTIDPENIDQRRLEAGLLPIGEYLAVWGGEWNVEEHKKRWKKE